MSLIILKRCLVLTLIAAIITIIHFGNTANNVMDRTKVMFKSISKPCAEQIPIVVRSIINLPQWYRNEDWGLREDASLRNLTVENKGLDKEESRAWNNFFFGTTNGLVLEIGAIEGNDYSVSKFFESKAKWRSILVEGNSRYAPMLAVNRPQAINVNLAICDQQREIHFADRMDASGIIEFMSEGYLKMFYDQILHENGTIDWKKAEKAKFIKKLQCFPLTHVLAPFKINHVNFFILDVEGGELKILEGINFEKVTFDVIAVETDRGGDTKENTTEYVNLVVDFLTSKGYVLQYRKEGRNSWFISPKFQPISKKIRST